MAKAMAVSLVFMFWFAWVVWWDASPLGHHRQFELPGISGCEIPAPYDCFRESYEGNVPHVPNLDVETAAKSLKSDSQARIMMTQIKKEWEEFKHARPGRRFEERYWRRKNEEGGKLSFRKLAHIVLGLAAMFTGLVLLAAPGPGVLVVVLGLGLLGSEFLFVARFLDWAEPKLRHLFARLKTRWQASSQAARVFAGAVVSIAALSAAYAVYRFVF